MPVCPDCGAEYVEGAKTCSDCQVPLISEEARQLDRPDPEIELVDVWECQGETEAQLLRGLLDSEGIDSLFKGEALRNVHGFRITKLGTVKVQVRSEDYERARRVILSARNLVECPGCGRLLEESSSHCLECGSALA